MNRATIHTSQCDRILAYLKEHGTIDPLTAWSECGVYRCGARIFDLRSRGYEISTGEKEVTNRYGEKCKVAEYRLEVAS